MPVVEMDTKTVLMDELDITYYLSEESGTQKVIMGFFFLNILLCIVLSSLTNRWSAKSEDL